MATAVSAPPAEVTYRPNELDRECAAKYLRLTTTLEDLTVEAAARPFKTTNRVDIKELGAILRTVETVWVESIKSYGKKWPHGKEQFAYIRVEHEFQRWRRQCRLSKCKFPTPRRPLHDYENSKDLTADEALALSRYEELIIDVKDQIIEIAKRKDFNADDDIAARVNGGEYNSLRLGWEGAIERYRRAGLRKADAFILGLKWAKACHQSYFKSIQNAAAEKRNETEIVKLGRRKTL
ncbi:hypothetical protein RUND412_006684 [Rhizina undulata]